MVYPKPTVAQRREVALRARGLCEYCCIPVKYSVQSFECEHILPIALGGDNSLNNLAFSCGGCNRCKSIRIMGIDVDSGLEAPLFNPRQQNWADHFVWDEDFTHVLG